MNGTLHIEVPRHLIGEVVMAMHESQALASTNASNECFIFHGGLRIDFVGASMQARFQNKEQMQTLCTLMERWCGLC